MKTYLAYTRVSTVKQGEHGSSLQEQKDSIEAYANNRGLIISGWFEEMETAAKLGRRMFNRMLSELEKGHAAGVIIHKIDRSARNLKDWAHLGELIDHGIEVHFAHESLDLASRGGRLSADIQAVVAADFIRNLRQEVRKGFYGRLKQGFYPLPAPMGYLNQGKAKAKTIDPIKGPMVRKAFELYASGGHSVYTLRHEMRKHGLQGKNGRALAMDVVARMLHNPFYIGLIRIERTGEVFQGQHEPLVRAATFNRVQALMSGRAYARPQRHDPLFRRLLKCAACGYGLVGESQKGRVYYRCHSRSCRGTSIRETLVANDVQAFFKLLTFPETDMRDFRDLTEADTTNVVAEAAARQEEHKRLLSLCDGRLTRLTDAFLDASIDKETFEHRKAGLLAERRSLLDIVQDASRESAAQGILKKLELANMAHQVLESAFVPEIRELLQTVTSNLGIMGKELVITPQFPFADVINYLFFQNGAPQRVTLRTGVTLCAVPLKDGRNLWINFENLSLVRRARTPLDFFRKLMTLNEE